MKKFLMVALCFVFVLGLTGCGGSKFEYTEAMIELRAHNIGLLGEPTVGDYLDYCIMDPEWSETDNYMSDKGTGAIYLKGKDKETGKSIEIRWIKNLTCGTCLTSMDEFKMDGESLGYSSYLSYLADYKEEVKKVYAEKED